MIRICFFVFSDQANMNITPLELSLCGGKIEDGKLIVEEGELCLLLVELFFELSVLTC